MTLETTQRKGARRIAEIPSDILNQLNRGEIETANLVEWLAIDQQVLMRHLLTKIDRQDYIPEVELAIKQLAKQSVNTVSLCIGSTLGQLARNNGDRELLGIMDRHEADMIRNWACYTIGTNDKLSLDQQLEHIRPFAADHHFGVREVAWIAVRPTLIKHLNLGLDLLLEWVMDTDENIRRFASELTRPRGVWCAHIDALKAEPEQALQLLEPLKSDPSKYVRDSVGNWLNDASKTQAEFVKTVCKRWGKESQTKETTYIVKRALRSINK